MQQAKIKLFTCLLLGWTLINPVQSATIIVNNAQDLSAIDGNCDLRDAINSANINISIDGCTAGQAGTQDWIIVQVAGPIQLESTLPVFSSMLISTTINAEPVEILAAPNQRIMRVVPNSINDNDFAITNFKFTGGHATDQNTGGAIYFSGTNAALGAIELNGMIFSNNQAYEGGALHFNETSADSLRIHNNTYLGNSAGNVGGAISGYRVVKPGMTRLEILHSHFADNSSGGSAGALFLRNEAAETAVLEDNQFINNVAVDNMGAVGLGAIFDNQTFEVNRNVFMFNQAGTNSGALEATYAAIVYIQDSLFAFNSAQRGGALTSVIDDALIRLNASTLVHNSATISGDNIHIFSTGRIIPSRNIIAHPVNGDNCAGVLGTTPQGNVGNNITDDASCELLDSMPLTTQADPLLTGFSIHADRYPGFAPTVDSLAIDSTEVCSDEDVMERLRPQDGDGDGIAFCDIGAIEAAESTDLIWSDSFGL